MRRSGRWMLWAGIAVAPIVVFLLLQRRAIVDPTWTVPDFHFFVVSLISLIALFMAGLLVIAAGQLKDARVIFLSLAFLAIAGIFAVHGLTTPNALFEGTNPWVGFSARLSLLSGSIFFALSTLDHHRVIKRLIVQRQGMLTVGVLVGLSLYAAVALVDAGRGGMAGGVEPATPAVEAYEGYDGVSGRALADRVSLNASDERFEFLQSERLALATTIVSLILFGVMTLHYGRLYLRFPTPLLLAVALSSAFLLQAQISMSTADLWQASWWEYHVLMLSAFIVVVVGLAMEYKHSGSLDGVVSGLLVRNTIDQLQRGYTDVIVALVNAVEAKDICTRGHTQRVTDLAIQIGAEMRLAPDRLRALSQAAMLHDIGKIGVPDSILNKTGPLTDAEFDIVKQHPVRGYAIIKEVRSLRSALGGIRHHHERLDGSGYPDGLVGDEIPLEARIIAVADVFDALTSVRSYRDAWPVDRALRSIQADAGVGLDSGCVAALGRLLAREERTARHADRDRTWTASEARSALAERTMAD